MNKHKKPTKPVPIPNKEQEEKHYIAPWVLKRLVKFFVPNKKL